MENTTMEILNWIFWIVGGIVICGAICLALWLSVVYLWDGYWFNTPSAQEKQVAEKVAEVHRWFWSFRDLDIIWDYVYGKPGNISDVRDAYARARSTQIADFAAEQVAKDRTRIAGELMPLAFGSARELLLEYIRGLLGEEKDG